MTNIRLAVARLHLKDGRVLTNQLLELDEHQHLLSFSPLQEETPFTFWHKGDWSEA